ncbi:MAG: glycoside hydrolase family 73 protein [Enterococcus faecium]|uniref:glycoside hydrolase family 73 protein n=1 Tax=Enterococcus faecium TaxID=1352 RepID=UPI000CF02608|nr:glycoside hydrolase family 73 protein [Enterococcus faecium]EGP5399372.1 mannosyl-glycoprotein endo-beta-N-acetylglucosamidase [Enterococcus faecium]EGP5632014.1 mannosyl-glycoprotein endo-beta-N-acetylglucosamidase [Enterococcus faecium]MBS6011042.1 glycoside hydrolase family 73 protein [Enterococcus faecium]PQC79366.1 mannosyl-glycoprotein endo-beta-N-acetylglucosamidase [Enterococcus faecium]
MKAKNLLFSVILLGNLAVANTTVLAEETTGTVTAQTTSSSEIGIENDTESTLQSATVSENTVSTEESTTGTTEQPQTEESTSAEAQKNPENAEEITNQLTDGQTLTHTHQADLSEFENYTGYAFSARSSANSQQAFIDSIASTAQSLASANDLYASVMIAQAIVESGWGNSALASAPNYNLFGIKGSYNGQSVTMPTSEYVNGQWITVNAAFRKYPSYKESLQDNVTVLKTTSFQPGVYYYSGAWKSNTNSYKDATAWLTGRYATAPNYGATLNNVIETYNLTQYDTAPTSTSPMYRLYNRHTGEHLYTLNAGEKNYLPTVGWEYEGIAWQAPNSGQPVYRLYNPYSGDHHYTMAQSEINSLTKIGWRYEGLSFYSGGSKPIYRLFNPNEKTGTHHYTLSAKERDWLTPMGWRYEGIGFYGY